MQSAIKKQTPAMTHDSKCSSNPATPATTATTDSPSTMMKNVPNRSVTCETTTACPFRIAHPRMGMTRSATIATPHSTYRYGPGTKIETSHSPVVVE